MKSFNWNAYHANTQRLYLLFCQLETIGVTFCPSVNNVCGQLNLTSHEYQQALTDLIQSGSLIPVRHNTYQINPQPARQTIWQYLI